MSLRYIWPALAPVVLVLGFLYLLDQRGRESERLQHATDSLNISIKAYQADSARRQTVIDSVLQVAASAESIAAQAGELAVAANRQRDSIVARVRADTGSVPRALFEAVVGADSAVIRDQAVQIEGLGTALVAMRAAFQEADAARLVADTLLREMTDNRDEWRTEAKRGNRIGLLVGFGWTAPSGQWQAMIGIGKRIRLPGLLGGL